MSTLPLQNPWWREGAVRPELLRDFKRAKFSELTSLMDSRQILLISGLRRVGKSTLMMQLIQWLISEKHADPLEIVYFSFDEKVENIQDVLKSYGELTTRHYDKPRERLYLFLDEIQKLHGWAEQVKLLYDALPRIKFVLSGSATLPLERDAKSILTGRMFKVDVKPLSFREFLQMKYHIEIKGEEDVALWRDKMPTYFSEYLRRSLPETVEMPESLIRRYTKESVVERISYKDIPETFGRVDYELVKSLVGIFFENPGYILNVDSLAKDLKRSKKTILDTIEYLAGSYLIRILKSYRPSTTASSRKLRRVYPYHFCLVSEDPIEEPKFMECVAASILDARYYWRKDSKEIDFVVGKVPIEMKWKERLSSDDYANLRYFVEKYDCPEAFIFTKSESSRAGEGRITSVPLWVAAFWDTHEMFGKIR